MADDSVRAHRAKQQRIRRTNKRDEVRTYDREYYNKNRQKKRAQAKARISANRDQHNAKRRAAYSKNPGKYLAESKRWRLNNPDKAHKSRATYFSEHRKRNIERLRKYGREWSKRTREVSVQRRLKDAIRARLVSAIKRGSKRGSAVRDLGCSIPEFITYIETMFLPGMSWMNWAPDTWHLDHIKPLASFDLSDIDEFRKAVHFTNYQPLWASDNLRKSNKS